MDGSFTFTEHVDYNSSNTLRKINITFILYYSTSTISAFSRDKVCKLAGSTPSAG